MSNDELFEKKKELTDRLADLSEAKAHTNNLCDRVEDTLSEDIAFLDELLSDSKSKRTNALIEEMRSRTNERMKANEELREEYLAEFDLQLNDAEEAISDIENELEKEDE